MPPKNAHKSLKYTQNPLGSWNVLMTPNFQQMTKNSSKILGNIVWGQVASMSPIKGTQLDLEHPTLQYYSKPNNRPK